jgi:nucleoside diphosphate kinase
MLEQLCKEYDSYQYINFTKAEMLENLKGTNLKYLKHICFCMLTPDTILRYLDEDILNYLSEKGIQILDFKIKYLSEKGIEEIYKYGFTEKILTRQKTHWWLTRKSYTLAPAIGLLVYVENLPNGFSNAYQYILSLKGKSIPANNTIKSSVRYQYKSISKTLALFHSSDDFISIIRESKLFFAWDRIAGVINKAAVGKVSDCPILTKCLFNVKDTNASGFEMLFRLKVRILNNIQYTLNRNGGCFSFYDALENLYEEALEKLESAENYKLGKEVMRNYLSLEREQYAAGEIEKIIQKLQEKSDIEVKKSINEFFEVKISIGDFISLLYVLLIFSDEKNFVDIDFDEIAEVLKANDIFLPEWEKLVIENFIFFYGDDTL